MVDKNKVANNMLEFLLDPTVIPVTQRLYFGPGERLQNDYYTNAKADAHQAYGDQKLNSDFYPSRNRQQSQREASVMDRKTVIASMDILAQNFAEDDPIAKDLRTMAYAIDKMGEDNFQARLAAKTFKCPTCGTKVLEQTSFCVKCKKKVKNPAGGKDKKADQNDPHFMYTGAPAGGNSPATPAPEVPKEQVGAMKPLGTPATSGAAPAPAAPAAPAPEGAMQYASLGKWSKKATDMVRKALISEVAVVANGDGDEGKEPHAEPHAEPEPTPAAPAAPAAPMAPEGAKECKTAEDAPMAPATAAPVPAAPGTNPDVPPTAEPKKDDKEATVDTSILGFDMSLPYMTAEDVGVLGSEEAARLESIMGFDSGLTADQKEKLGL